MLGVLEKNPDPKPLPPWMIEMDELTAMLVACVEKRTKNDIERFIMFEFYVNRKKPREISPLLEEKYGLQLTAKQVADKRYGVIQRIRKNPCPDLFNFL